MRTATEWLRRYPPSPKEQIALAAYVEKCVALEWKIEDNLRANYLAYRRVLGKWMYPPGKRAKEWVVEENAEMLADHDIMHAEMFPRPYHGKPFQVNLAVLVMISHHPRTNHEVPAEQVAKTAMILRRDAGFTFRRDEKEEAGVEVADANNYGNNERDKTIFHMADGTTAREIVGYDKSKVVVTHSWNRLPDELIAPLRRLFPIDPNGRVRPTGDVDHRTPENTRKELCMKVVSLTCASLEDKSWDEHYRVISREYNDEKREACGKCQRRERIPLPPMMQPFAAAFLDFFKGTCQGCLWHDHLKPLKILGPEHAVGLEAAKMAWAAQLDRAAELSRKYRAKTRKRQEKS